MSDLKEKLRKEFLDDEDAAYAYYNDFLNVYIATQIKVIREQRGYGTQTAFAKASGIKQEQLSRLEDIDNNSWSVNTLRRVARALGVTVRVSFEAFSDSIETIVNFNRNNLQRDARIKSLTEPRPEKREQTETPEEAIKAAISKRTGTPSNNRIVQDSKLIQLLTEKSSYEISDYQSSEGNLALPPSGPKSAREGIGEKRPY